MHQYCVYLYRYPYGVSVWHVSVEMSYGMGLLLLLLRCFSCVQLFVTMDCSPPGSSAHGILDKNTGVGLPCLPPADLPNPGVEPRSPALQADSLPPSHQGSLAWVYVCVNVYGCVCIDEWMNRWTSLGYM